LIARKPDADIAEAGVVEGPLVHGRLGEERGVEAGMSEGGGEAEGVKGARRAPVRIVEAV
jgi:hypothetical protein